MTPTARLPRVARTLFGAVVGCLVLLVAAPAVPANAGTPIPTLGSSRGVAYDLPQGTVVDDYPWLSYARTYLGGNTTNARQCVGFALWRLDNRSRLAVNTTLTKLSRAYRMAGARDLDNAAVKAGYRVDRVPAVGSLAQWEAGVGGAGSAGHVGYVARVYSDGTVVVEEYNGARKLAYGVRRVKVSTISHFLHLAPKR